MFYFPKVLRYIVYDYLTDYMERKHASYSFDLMIDPNLSKEELNNSFFGDISDIRTFQNLNTDAKYDILVKIYNKVSTRRTSPEARIKYRSPNFTHDGFNIVYDSIKVKIRLSDGIIYLSDIPYVSLGTDNVQFCIGNNVSNSVPGQVIIYLLKNNGLLYFTFIYGTHEIKSTPLTLIPFVKSVIWLQSQHVLSLDGQITKIFYQQAKKVDKLPIIKQYEVNVCDNVYDMPISFAINDVTKQIEVQYLSGNNKSYPGI